MFKYMKYNENANKQYINCTWERHKGEKKVVEIRWFPDFLRFFFVTAAAVVAVAHECVKFYEAAKKNIYDDIENSIDS